MTPGSASAPHGPPCPLPNSGRRAQREDLRYRVLRLLEADPEISQRALARRLGVSLGGVHACLRALVGAGLVSARPGGAQQKAARRSGQAYVLTRAGQAEKAALTTGFLGRKRAEHAALGVEIAVLEAEMGLSPGAAGRWTCRWCGGRGQP